MDKTVHYIQFELPGMLHRITCPIRGLKQVLKVVKFNS